MTTQSSQAIWQALPAAFRLSAAQAKTSILLETAKPTGSDDRSFLFLNPTIELIAWHPRDLAALLEEVDRHLAAGAYVAGYFNYECGETFVGLSSSSRERERSGEPLAWLGVFPHAEVFRHTADVVQEMEEPTSFAEAIVDSDGLEISPADYRDRIRRVQEYLAAGHSYQVNFTDRMRGRIHGSAMATYETLLKRQPVSYAAYIQREGGTFLSFSPELFYHTSGGKITVRPMKGTWPRGLNQDEDREAEEQLRQDEKNRSEHVTIVDLLRNDLGRICRPGSVAVDWLFSVERYNTLLQMTSTISGSLEDDLSPSQVFQKLFPSGSITGAPKKRTMEIIRELESQPRGIYTGAIGYFAPNGEACFNVAIRTMALRGEAFSLGVGGGITLDSQADQEYEECRLKGAFLTHRRPPLALLETMRCTDTRIPLLDLHMRRLASSAAYFGIRYDEDALVGELSERASHCGAGANKVRVELNARGEWTISVSPIEGGAWHGRVLLAADRTDSRDVFLRHKTTIRQFYDEQLADARAAGFDEVLFRNDKSELTEGAISNVFLFARGQWLTPSLRCGLLAGVQRAAELQALPNVTETSLYVEDLKDVEQVLVCNALRGTRKVYELWSDEGEVLWRDPSLVGSLKQHS